ncbi:RTA1 like protein [Macroventuria anomochaeta]|uniref:RTA1 like protein n=1 Tax=Macroventuria anomochaeta TaxID=301207 RepID=A0ACB6SD87_9PLEO|nr:RTA1 like protein [Macroventuria anomochaeta]KAF2631274.1 RTA1 like protein [Macroventuria anomochaeta]
MSGMDRSVIALLDSRAVDLPKRAAAGYTHGVLNPYIYDPSVPLASVGATVIILISILSIYQYVRHRAWFFWAAIIAILMLVLGHVCRLVSSLDEFEDLPFLFSWLLILLAPSFLAAACYTAFSRVVWFSCPTYALNFKTLWCFPRWITPTFVIFDLFSFLIQLVGASQISRQYDKDSSPSRSIEESEREALPGRVILILGLVLQMLCFLSFSIISVRYFVISRYWRAFDLGDMKLWRKLSYTINLSSVLIAIRAIYRTMEIPHDKEYGLIYLQSHEWCFWTFDALPILAVLIVFAVWHPGRYLPRSYTGLKLDKVRAMKEKDEISSMAGGQQEAELRDLKPEDFQTRRPEERV